MAGSVALQQTKEGDKTAMARRRMVTRSLYTTAVKYIVFNNETNKTGEEETILTGEYKTDESALKAIKGVITSDKLTPLKVIAREVSSELYGVDEADFIKYAKKLENRNNKLADDSEDTAEEAEQA